MFRCLTSLFVLLVLGGLLYFGHGFLLEKAGDYLVLEEDLKPADVIVVLGGEVTERVVYGAKLFRDGWSRKDRIIVTGGPVVWKYTGASLMKEHAESLGVPGKQIIAEERPVSTEEEAVFTREILRRHGYKSLILVTSPYHSRRASTIFRKVMGSGIRVTSAPVEDSWFRTAEWWKKPKERKKVLSEYAKFLELWIFGVKAPGAEAPEN